MSWLQFIDRMSLDISVVNLTLDFMQWGQMEELQQLGKSIQVTQPQTWLWKQTHWLLSAIFKLGNNGDGGKKGCLADLRIRLGRLPKKFLPQLDVLQHIVRMAEAKLFRRHSLTKGQSSSI